MRPNFFNIDHSMRDTYRRPIYVTAAELRNWAMRKYNEGEEGNPYYGELEKWQDAMKQIAAIFDGTGTYVDPISGEEVNLPAFIEDWHDVDNLMKQDYNVRLMAWPLFPYGYMYTDDNDEEWAWIMETTCGKIKRYCSSCYPGLYRALGALSIKYNPIADYWRKGSELGASAPYVSLTNPSSGEEPTISNWNDDSAHTDGYKTQTQTQGDNKPTTKNYTTTYDDSSEGRLASYSTQEGGTEQVAKLPNSGIVKKYQEEGNKGANVQSLLVNEIELANEMEGLFDNFMRGLEKRIFLSYYSGA